MKLDKSLLPEMPMTLRLVTSETFPGAFCECLVDLSEAFSRLSEGKQAAVLDEYERITEEDDPFDLYPNSPADTEAFEAFIESYLETDTPQSRSLNKVLSALDEAARCPGSIEQSASLWGASSDKEDEWARFFAALDTLIETRKLMSQAPDVGRSTRKSPGL